MGNYLLSLRVPPSEDERNHPLYYDWTIPKRGPFRDSGNSTSSDMAPKLSHQVIVNQLVKDKAGDKSVLTKDKPASMVDPSSNHTVSSSNSKKSHSTKSKIPKSTSLAANLKKEDSVSSAKTDDLKKPSNIDNQRAATTTKAAVNTQSVKENVNRGKSS